MVVMINPSDEIHAEENLGKSYRNHLVNSILAARENQAPAFLASESLHGCYDKIAEIGFFFQEYL